MRWTLSLSFANCFLHFLQVSYRGIEISARLLPLPVLTCSSWFFFCLFLKDRLRFPMSILAALIIERSSHPLGLFEMILPLFFLTSSEEASQL